ncbi:MAG TPA: molybdate ABC transporter substrate-binding protein [Dehalococcoidia bacterium]|nr:molybdate ABC transporter substrate-binding protein [Dehalococcoidia bacterium]
MRLALALATLALALSAAACAGDDRPRLDVAAAADLRDAFEELIPAFERACDCRVRVAYGSSGTFATQIEQGLPMDVFFSADEAYIDRLAREGLVRPESVRLYALGRIVIAAPWDDADPPAALDALLDPAIRHVALPNPDHAPYGAAGKRALETAGLWEALLPKIVFGENAVQAADFVERGDADAGILPLSLTVQRQGRLRYALVDDDLYEPLRQAAGTLARSDRLELAAAFVEYVVGPEGRDIMRKYGFIPPEEGAAP